MIDSDELRVFYTETAFVCTTFDFPMHLMNRFSWFNNLFETIMFFVHQYKLFSMILTLFWIERVFYISFEILLYW